MAKLDRSIAAIRAEGREVGPIGAVPPQPFDVPRRLAHLARAGRLAEAQGVARSWLDARTVHLRALFARWQAQGVRLIDPAVGLCDARHCAIEQGGKPLYFDSHHLSVTGARLVIARGG